MPELPEVEFVASSLNKLISGRTIKRSRLLRAKLAPDLTPPQFSSRLAGAKVRFVHRRGKHILFDLDKETTLLVHLRMSGRFLLLGPDRDDPVFTHAVFHLDDGARIVFQDQRHFGLMRIVETARLFDSKELARLAPEPFSGRFTNEYLYNSLRCSRRLVKAFLLDQSKVCGMGNIYASEALFLARLHPAKRAHTISRPKTSVLFEKIRETLSIAFQEMSAFEPVDGDGQIGGYGDRISPSWRVYDREQKPCVVCRAPIRRIKQAGRSTYFCPVCQRR